MATFNAADALAHMKKQQAQNKQDFSAIAELASLKAKLKVTEAAKKMLEENNALLSKDLVSLRQGVSLESIREYAKDRAVSFNVSPAPISKLKDGITILNWLDAAIWRKTEAGEMKDGLAD